MSVPDYEKIYVDGCCNRDSGNCGWGSVCDHKGIPLLSLHTDLLSDMCMQDVKTPKGIQKVIISEFSDVKSQQNNGAELLALVVGLRIALHTACKCILSDSQLLVQYWSLDKVSPNTKKKMDPLKYRYIKECYELRKKFEISGGKILKISGDDNIADLGYHK